MWLKFYLMDCILDWQPKASQAGEDGIIPPVKKATTCGKALLDAANDLFCAVLAIVPDAVLFYSALCTWEDGRTYSYEHHNCIWWTWQGCSNFSTIFALDSISWLRLCHQSTMGPACCASWPTTALVCCWWLCPQALSVRLAWCWLSPKSLECYNLLPSEQGACSHDCLACITSAERGISRHVARCLCWQWWCWNLPRKHHIRSVALPSWIEGGKLSLQEVQTLFQESTS